MLPIDKNVPRRFLVALLGNVRSLGFSRTLCQGSCIKLKLLKHKICPPSKSVLYMSEIHEVNLEEVVKEILDYVWLNVRETFVVKDTGIVNVETIHAVISVANGDSVIPVQTSVTPLQTEFGNPSQTPVRDSVSACMMKDLATSPQRLRNIRD